MSADFTEVTGQSWLGRIVESIKGVLFGIVLILAAFVLLWWNEGRAVKTAKTLAEGAKSVVSVAADKVDPANEQRLVHMTGEATTPEKLWDPDFAVSAPAIKLIRNVEMYQWKESTSKTTRKKLGGGTETITTYNYSKEWSDTLNDSSSFKAPAGHQNPAKIPYEQNTITAKYVTVGAFKLPEFLISQISKDEKLTMTTAELKALPAYLINKTKINTGGFYIGADPVNSRIGDMRVSFSVVKPMTVSIVARQIGNSFEEYKATAGGTIGMLSEGAMSVDNMFQTAVSQNKTLTWILRLVGFVVMLFGFLLILNPLVVVADVVPLIGSFLGAGAFLISLALSSFFSFITIAVAWVAFRPVLGVALIVLAVAAVVAFGKMARGKSSGRVVSPA